MFPFNVNPLNFNAPVSAFHKFFNSVRGKKSFLVASLNEFCTAPMTSLSDENLLPLRARWNMLNRD
jgi:hypothetical protein